MAKLGLSKLKTCSLIFTFDYWMIGLRGWQRKHVNAESWKPFSTLLFCIYYASFHFQELFQNLHMLKDSNSTPCLQWVFNILFSLYSEYSRNASCFLCKLFIFHYFFPNIAQWTVLPPPLPTPFKEWIAGFQLLKLFCTVTIQPLFC